MARRRISEDVGEDETNKYYLGETRQPLCSCGSSGKERRAAGLRGKEIDLNKCTACGTSICGLCQAGEELCQECEDMQRGDD